MTSFFVFAVGATALITVPSVVAIWLNMLPWSEEAKERVVNWLIVFIGVATIIGWSISFASAVTKEVEEINQSVKHSSVLNRKEVNRGDAVKPKASRAQKLISEIQDKMDVLSQSISEEEFNV